MNDTQIIVIVAGIGVIIFVMSQRGTPVNQPDLIALQVSPNNQSNTTVV